MKATTTDHEPLPVEMLIPRHARRITVRDHERWQATGRPPHEGDADIEELILELRTIERDRSR